MKSNCYDCWLVQTSAQVIDFAADGKHTISEMLAARGYKVELERVNDTVVLKSAWKTGLHGVFFVAVGNQPMVMSVNEFIPEAGVWISVSFISFRW